MSDARSDAISFWLLLTNPRYERTFYTPSWIATGTSDDDASGSVPDPFYDLSPFYVPALDITKVLS